MPRSRSAARSTLDRIRASPREMGHRYRRLSVRSKMIFWAASVLSVASIIAVIIITPRRIAQWVNVVALEIRGLGVGGMFILGILVVMVSHPPLFGFAGSMSLIGFTYGIWPGFLIASISSLLGGAIAFLSVRTFFLGWIKKNDKWDAFARVIGNKGLPLITMIRYCLPWALGNGLFASIEGVKFWQFMLANLLIQPRLLIPVFIGSRLVSLADENPTHDPARFWLNLISIGLSLSVSVITGIWVYRLTLEQMRKFDREGGGVEGELAAEALEREQGALLGDYSDDEEMEDEPLTDRSGRGIAGERVPGGGLLRRTSSGETA